MINKEGIILKDCKACGAKLPADMAHKLVTFILRDLNESSRKSKKDKKNKKDQTDSPAEPAEDDNEDELTKRINSEAALIPTVEDGEEDDDFLEDTSPEAVARRQQELAANAGAISKLLEDGDEDHPREVFARYVTENALKVPHSQILAKANELDVRMDKACVVMVQVLFNEKILTEKQVAKYAPLFRVFSKHEKSEKSILGGTERLVGIVYPSLLPKTPLILKELYENDLVSEDAFLLWADKLNKKYIDDKALAKSIRKKAEPFINWLREASEEESSDED